MARRRWPVRDPVRTSSGVDLQPEGVGYPALEGNQRTEGIRVRIEGAQGFEHDPVRALRILELELRMEVVSGESPEDPNRMAERITRLDPNRRTEA
jgi:hypothetical protein